MTDDSPVSPSVRLVEAVAEVEGVDPIELDFILSDAFDPEALDDLVNNSRESVTVELSLGTHHVIVTDERIRVDGTVTVELE